VKGFQDETQRLYWYAYAGNENAGPAFGLLQPIHNVRLTEISYHRHFTESSDTNLHNFPID
jgi:hypothetical protein